jgi:hypothetical protein
VPSYPALRAAGLALLVLSGCGTVKSPTEPPPGEPGGAALSFSQIQSEVFTPTCAKAGCHDAAAASAGLVLAAGRSHGDLVGRPSTQNGGLLRVAPGNPEASYLLRKLRGDPSITGDRMPQDGPPYLTPEQIEGIAAWVRAGAPND